MSVLTFLPPTHPDAWFSDSFRSAPCFYCAEPLSDPFVLWMGAGEPLVLHPGCTVELAIRLFRDVHQIECTTDTYVTAPRTLPEPRARLRREEGIG